MPFSLHARAETMNPKLIAALAAAGCRHVVYGVESGSERIRREVMKRPVTNDRLVEIFERTREAGMLVTANYMLGVPGERPEDLQATLDLHRQLKPTDFGYFVFYPFPGTQLFETCRQQGQLPEDWQTPAGPPRCLDPEPARSQPRRHRPRLCRMDPGARRRHRRPHGPGRGHRLLSRARGCPPPPRPRLAADAPRGIFPEQRRSRARFHLCSLKYPGGAAQPRGAAPPSPVAAGRRYLPGMPYPPKLSTRPSPSTAACIGTSQGIGKIVAIRAKSCPTPIRRGSGSAAASVRS